MGHSLTIYNAEGTMSLLLFLYSQCHIAPESADDLRSISLQLSAHMNPDSINATLLASFVEASPGHPLLLSLGPLIERFQHACVRNVEATEIITSTVIPLLVTDAKAQTFEDLAYHVVLLTDKSLVRHCNTEQLAAAAQCLFESILVLISDFFKSNDLVVATAIGEASDALTSLLVFASNSLCKHPLCLHEELLLIIPLKRIGSFRLHGPGRLTGIYKACLAVKRPKSKGR
jgi:hypothetical protein